MDILSAVILGIIQGSTEFIPVSSSAHLYLAQTFFGLADSAKLPGLDAVLHAGTLFAVLFAYRSELSPLFGSLFTAPVKLLKRRGAEMNGSERTVCFAAFATLPIIAAALLGADGMADAVSRSPSAIGAALIVNGFVLMAAQRARPSGLTSEEVCPRHALCAGLFQAAAILPGISRSGSMTAGGVLSGVRRDEAVRLSFISSIPAVIGACVFRLPDMIGASPDAETLAVYAAGFAAAAVSGVFAIRLIKTVSGRSGPGCFSIYCFAAGAAVITACSGG